MNVETKNERLAEAVRVLEAVKPAKLYMGHWYDNFAPDECGTTACAAGHCALDPWFIDRGFSLEPTRYQSLADGEPIPTFDGKQGFRACVEFFGIDLGDAYRVFDTAGYSVAPADITPKMVADSLRALMD